MSLAIGLICSLLVIVPVGVLLFGMDKGGQLYQFWWSCAVGVFAAICFATCAYVLSWPFYSQTERQSMNPGGPSGSVLFGILFWVLGASVVLPSFPALLLLGLFPPKSHSTRKRFFLAAVIVLFAIVSATLIMVKQRTYNADYQSERSKPTQAPFERFEHLRANPADDVNGDG